MTTIRNNNDNDDNSEGSNKPWLLVVCAMEAEARAMEAQLENIHVLDPPLVVVADTAQIRRVSGTRSGIRVDVLTCGIGEVDAAVVTTAVLAKEQSSSSSLLSAPMAVLSVGCAGSHADELRAGDVVISTSIVPAAYRVVMRDATVQHIGQRRGANCAPLREVHIDEYLLAAAKRLITTTSDHIELPPWPGATRPPCIVHGKVCSSDTWTQDTTEIRRMQQTLGTACEEMEAYGVVRACSLFGITRFIAVKDISNNELRPSEATKNASFDGDHAWVLREIGVRAAAVAAGIIDIIANDDVIMQT